MFGAPTVAELDDLDYRRAEPLAGSDEPTYVDPRTRLERVAV